jgi:hypothetical protein
VVQKNNDIAGFIFAELFLKVRGVINFQIINHNGLMVVWLNVEMIKEFEPLNHSSQIRKRKSKWQF